MIAFLLFEQTMSSPVFVQADTGFDKTAPVLNGFTIANANNLDAEKDMTITFDLKEDGVGVNCIYLRFVGQETGKMKQISYMKDDDNLLLYSGKTTTTLSFEDTGFYKEKYLLIGVYLTDVNGNATNYSVKDEPECLKNSTKAITITHSLTTDVTSPQIKSLIINNANNVDLSTDGMDFSVDLVENGIGVSNIWFRFQNDEGKDYNVAWGTNYIRPDGTELHTGNYKLKTGSENMFRTGTYTLVSVTIEDFDSNYTEYNSDSTNWNKFTQKMVVTKAAYVESKAPTISKIVFKDTIIKTPDLLEVPMTITSDQYGVDWIDITLVNDKGELHTLIWYSKQPIYSGTYTIKFSVDPYWGEGTFHILSIGISSPSGEGSGYYDSLLNDIDGFVDAKITVTSAFDMVYYGATANVKAAVNAINAMKEGQTAVLDYRYYNKADISIFQAIAGKNKTVVFENQDVQWVFNGKDVALNKCKTIDLNVDIYKRKGSDFGYSNDDYILLMNYARNGVLPGAVDMRINNAYLKEKFKVTSDLILSYYSTAAEVLDTEVDCAEDGYAEYNISHNSSYILSDKMPSLTAPKGIKAASYKCTSSKLSWNRVAGANGYDIYRSTSKTGTYMKVGTVTNGKTLTWVDKSVAYGKTYYYKIQAKGSNKKVKAKTSSIVSCKINVPKVSGLYAASIATSSLRLHWKENPGVSGYDIYQYKTSKWVKVMTNRHSATLATTIYNLSSGKDYKFKVRAYKIIKGKKYYGTYSNVLSTTTKKKTKN